MYQILVLGREMMCLERSLVEWKSRMKKRGLGKRMGLNFPRNIKLGLVWTSPGLRNDSARREECQ